MTQKEHKRFTENKRKTDDETPHGEYNTLRHGRQIDSRQKPMQLGKLKQKLDGNEDILRELLHIFVGDAEANRQTLKLFLQQKNTRGIARIAHNLKGILSSIEADDAYQTAVALEKAGEENCLADAKILYTLLEKKLEFLTDFISQTLRYNQNEPGSQ